MENARKRDQILCVIPTLEELSVFFRITVTESASPQMRAILKFMFFFTDKSRNIQSEIGRMKEREASVMRDDQDLRQTIITLEKVGNVADKSSAS